ncbi:MAG: fluoride efflux transporter CrcB [Solirubrobacterales bacterium]
MSPLAWVGVALLGGAGAVARFGLDYLLSEASGGPFPFGTTVVNLTGAAILGLLAGLALEGVALTLLAGGALGSFTTFSTWMFETQRLGEAGRGRLLLVNLVLPLAAGLAAVAAGRAIGSSL